MVHPRNERHGADELAEGQAWEISSTLWSGSVDGHGRRDSPLRGESPRDR